MRILLHDYAGHAFPIELSRELAGRGHDVLHLYAGYNVTPRGDLKRRLSDPPTLSISPVFIRKPLQKYSFFRRWLQELEYGRLLADNVHRVRPEIIISCQTPLDSQRIFQHAAEKTSSRFVFWAQDVIGIATLRLMGEKFGVVGKMIGKHYINLEKVLLRRSDHIVVISDAFESLLIRWGIDPARMSVIQNWAPIERIPLSPKHNSWSQEHLPDGGFTFMYTGTLGMKHNPDHLRLLAQRYREEDGVRVVVISEGPGADWLVKQKTRHGLTNLMVLPYQPFERISEVMGAADVLIALLDPGAGEYSVPSKILSYLCAGRPILLAVPLENLAAKTVDQNQAGLVISPDHPDALLAAADRLLADPDLRARLGENGRSFAEKHFDVRMIADRFEGLLTRLA